MMTKTSSISQIIKKRRNKVLVKNEFINLFLRIIFLIIVGFLIFTQVFILARIRGNEMFPAVKDGDLIIAFRLQSNYEKKDIISFKLDGERKVARYMAQGGDVVNMDDTGVLLINGAVQSGEIMYPTYARDGIEFPYQVPEGHVFVLGDYRTQATDSRDFGPIPVEDIEGKVITLLRRRGL